MGPEAGRGQHLGAGWAGGAGAGIGIIRLTAWGWVLGPGQSHDPLLTCPCLQDQHLSQERVGSGSKLCPGPWPLAPHCHHPTIPPYDLSPAPRCCSPPPAPSHSPGCVPCPCGSHLAVGVRQMGQGAQALGLAAAAGRNHHPQGSWKARPAAAHPPALLHTAWTR